MKPALNYVGVLHSIFEHAQRREWVVGNPCKLADKPRVNRSEAALRFLTVEEVEAVVDAVPDDDLGRVERVLYLTAAMTGLRQGECSGLQWADIDWAARRVRVRRAFTQGEFTSRSPSAQAAASRSRTAWRAS